METPRILTRCEACGNQTLFVSPGGHLTCSWIPCPAPSVEAARQHRVEAIANTIYDWVEVAEKHPEIVASAPELLKAAAHLVLKARR